MSSKKSDMEIIQEIVDLVKEIGWEIALPMDEMTEDGKVHGLVMGNEYFIQELLKDYTYELFSMEEDEEGNLKPPTSKGSLH
jgi:hypothetical protein